MSPHPPKSFGSSVSVLVGQVWTGVMGVTPASSPPDHQAEFPPRCLEFVTQRELHYARLGERGTILAEICAGGQVEVLRRQSRIKTHRIGDVEYLPAELKPLSFLWLPGLAQAGIDTEISWTAKHVALASFAR